MTFSTVERDTLIELLQLAQGIVERKSLNPILSAVILSSTPEGNLEVQATNMEESLRVKTRDKLDGDIKVAIPLVRLVDFIKELSPGAVSLGLSEEGALLTIGQEKAWAHLPILSTEDFPVLPPTPDITFPMNREVLLRVFSKVFLSIATDSISTALKGLLVKKINGGVAFVSTDGHRLSLLKVEHSEMPQGSLELVVPRKGIQEMGRLLERSAEEQLQLGVTQNHLYAATERGEIFIRLLDAKYPNYQKVIPQEFTAKVVLSKEYLQKAVRRASLFSSDRLKGVRMEVGSQRVRISSMAGVDEPFSGSAVEEMDAIEFSGEEVKLGLNARYVVEVLSVLDGGEVVMEMGSRLWPVKFTSQEAPDYLHIVMPLQLEDEL